MGTIARKKRKVKRKSSVHNEHRKRLEGTIRALKRDLERAKKKAKKSLEKSQKKLAIEKKKRIKEISRLKRNARRREKYWEKKVLEEEEIARNPRHYIEKELDKLWDKYGRDGDDPAIKRRITVMSKRFQWTKDEMWHMYFSPTWR
jgi:hypothetical protein